MGEYDIAIADLGERVGRAHAEAAVWKARALALGWGLEPENTENDEENLDKPSE